MINSKNKHIDKIQAKQVQNILKIFEIKMMLMGVLSFFL